MARLFASASSQSLSVDSAPVSAFPFTMSCWAYKTDYGADCAVWLGDKDVIDQWLGYLVFKGTVPGQDFRAASYDGTAGAADSVTQYSTGIWYHGCGVFVSTTSRFVYLDGGSKVENTTSINPTGTDRLSIGAYGDSTPGGYMEGAIAEVGIWNVALTDAEVAALAAGYSSLFVRPQSLVFYLPLIRDDDEDLVGGLSLTANGGPTITAHPRIIYPTSPYAGFSATAIAPSGIVVLRRRRAA